MFSAKESVSYEYAWSAFFAIVVCYGLRKYFCVPPSSVTTNAFSKRRRIIRDPQTRRPPPVLLSASTKNAYSTTHSRRVEAAIQKTATSLLGTEGSTSDISMAAGYRRLPRNQRPQHLPTQINTQAVEGANGVRTNTGCPDVPPAPKHIPFPFVPQDGDMIFEVIVFVYILIAGSLQYLHLYRTVWWLPHSYTNQTMNFYLIDPYLVGFITVMLARRLLYLSLQKLFSLMCSTRYLTMLENTARIIFLALNSGALLFCVYNLTQNHPLVNIFYLCYPLLVYFILFRCKIAPFLEFRTAGEIKFFLGGGPLHNCSSSASAIRNEVETLKTDFNARMKQVLFSSVINAYYACFVPCCFAQSYLFYDMYWATQHLVFVWVGCFTMYAAQSFPPRYLDVMHRASLHLGHWNRVESRPHLPPAFPWTGDTLWTAGVLVRHFKELYKSQSQTNAAEPGNSCHYRFYAIFHNPSTMLCILLALHMSLVVVQLGILVNTTEWNQLLSLGIMLFANYYTLFKLARDYLVAWKVYKAEQMIYNKGKLIILQ